MTAMMLLLLIDTMLHTVYTDQSPLSTLLKEWEAKGKEKSVIYCYIEPSVSPNANILNKVKQMSKRERFILGEKLLRDHFRYLIS